MNPTPHSSPQTRRLQRKWLWLAAAGQLLISAAQAQDNDGYWTFGISAGQTRGEFDERALDNRNSTTVPPNAITSLSIATDRRDAGGKVFWVASSTAMWDLNLATSTCASSAGKPPPCPKERLPAISEAVKDYLVRTRGLDAGKVSAVGMGESQPVIKAQDCRGNQRSAKLVACLQPDRRVELEVVGTR